MKTTEELINTYNLIINKVTADGGAGEIQYGKLPHEGFVSGNDYAGHRSGHADHE